jgi:thymidine kinase
VFNARKVDGRFIFDGDQVAIDGADVTYESLCGACYLDESGGVLNNGWRPKADFSYRTAPDPDFA